MKRYILITFTVLILINIFLGSYYLFFLTKTPQKFVSSNNWISLDWKSAEEIITFDCIPEYLSNDDEKINYLNDTFDYSERGILMQIQLDNNQNCWAVSTEADDFGESKILYKSINGGIKELYVKNLNLKP